MNDFLIKYRHKDRCSKRGQTENVATIMRLLCDAIIRLSISLHHPSHSKKGAFVGIGIYFMTYVMGDANLLGTSLPSPTSP